MEQLNEQPTNIRVKNITAGISWGQLLIVAFTTIVTISGLGLQFWKSTDQRITMLEMRMQAKENSDKDINLKLDKVIDKLDDVKVAMQNKQDRKN